MKTITDTELKSILDSHKLWFESCGDKGKFANLTGADLSYANLTGADLRDANLRSANLYGANLTGADLRGADLVGADLTGADITRTDLADADLTCANLTGTILEKKAEEKQQVVSSVKAESNLRSEIEEIAKKHGMKVDSIALSFL